MSHYSNLSYQQFRKSVSYLWHTVLPVLCTAGSKKVWLISFKSALIFRPKISWVEKFQSSKIQKRDYFRQKGVIFGFGVNEPWHWLLKFWTWPSKKSPKCPKWDIYKTQFSNLVCSIRIFCLFSSLIKISHTYDSRCRTRSRTFYVTLCNVEWKKYDGVSLNCSLIDLKLARDWLRRFLKIFDRSDTNSVLMTLFDSASWITDSFSRINNAVELSS